MAKTIGNVITFRVYFRDGDGNDIELDSAELDVNYPRVRLPSISFLGYSLNTDTTVTLEEDDGVWTGTWDSSASDPGMVHWVATGLEDDGTIHVREGRVKLIGNRIPSATSDNDAEPPAPPGSSGDEFITTFLQMGQY